MLLNTLVLLILALIFQFHSSYSRKVKTEVSQLKTPYAVTVLKLFGAVTGSTFTGSYTYNTTHFGDEYHGRDSMLLVVLVNEEMDTNLYTPYLGYTGYKPQDISVEDIQTLCQQPSHYRKSFYLTAPNSGKEQSGSFVYTIPYPDRYTAYIMRCLVGSSNYSSQELDSLDFNFELHLSNWGEELPVEEISLINMSVFFIIVYTVLLLVLIGQLFRAESDTVKPIHYLFLATMIAAIFTYTFYYVYLNDLNEFGEVTKTLTILVQATDHIFSTLFLACMLLISLGWTISRTFLPEKEKNFTYFAIGAYLLAGLCHSTCTGDDQDGAQCDFFNVITYVMKTIILLGIVVAMNFTITQHRTIILHSPWIQNILLQYARTKQFNNFRAVFLFYLILPTVILLLEFSILSWRTQWIADMMIQLVDVMIVVSIGVSFYPISEQYLSRAFDGTMDSSVRRRGGGRNGEENS